MIDAKDQGTQPLDLGDTPKRRGRPSTGSAMSNADRQRAYRERQKAQRNENNSAAENEALERLAIEHTEFVKRKQKEVDQLKARIQELERQLESRNGKTFWHVEMCPRGKRTWEVIGLDRNNPFKSRTEAEAFAERMRGDGAPPGFKYRVVQA